MSPRLFPPRSRARRGAIVSIPFTDHVAANAEGHRRLDRHEEPARAFTYSSSSTLASSASPRENDRDEFIGFSANMN